MLRLQVVIFNTNGSESPRSRQKSSPQVNAPIIFSPPEIKVRYFRGIFTLRKRYDNLPNSWLTVQLFIWNSELKFFYQEGASHLFPEAW